MKHKNKPANVGRGHVPSDREAADRTNEKVCTQSVVPAQDCRIAALLAMTNKGAFMSLRGAQRRGNLFCFSSLYAPGSSCKRDVEDAVPYGERCNQRL